MRKFENEYFNVPVGYFDAVQTCELVRCLNLQRYMMFYKRKKLY